MIYAKINGFIEFNEESAKQYNREFTATLEDSDAFSYGNKTAVIITFGQMANGRTPESILLDTRYDTTIKKNAGNFAEWIKQYFADNYQPHVLTIYL